MATSIAPAEDTNDKDSININSFNNIATIRASLHQQFASLIDAIKQRENQLLQELDSIEQTYRHEYQKYQTTIDALEKTKKLAEENLLPEDITDIRENITKQIDERLKSIKLKIESKIIEFKWDTNLANAILNIGRLISSERPTSLSIDYKKKINPSIKTSKQGSGAGELNYAWGVATDTNTNNIYVADHTTHRVCVFSSEGEFLFQFSGNTNNTVKMSHPIGIAIYENKVFVSQYNSHCIQIHNLDGTYMQQFGSQGSGKDQLNRPYGITISPIDGDIYVCDFNNNRVQIFSRDYKHKSFLGVNQLKHPRDVKVAQQEIIILDGNTPCVHVYDYNNNLLKSIINKTGGGYNIKDAFFIYVDTDNNIILSDYGGGVVLIFSCTGEIIHQIRNAVKMFTHPHGVMVDTLGRLIVVSQQPDACLQIF